MKNFNWTQFTKKIAIKAELSDIYNAWTKAAEIEKWFLILMLMRYLKKK